MSDENVVHGISAISHLSLLLFLSLLWSYQSCKKPNTTKNTNTNKFCLYKATLATCLLLATSNLIYTCLLFWLWPPDTSQHIPTPIQLDLVVRTLVYFLIPLYLHLQFSPYGGTTFPIFFKLWWIFFTILNSCFLALHLFHNPNHPISIHVSVLHSGSAAFGVILAVTGIRWKRIHRESDSMLEEPLLIRNDTKSSRFSTASFVSLLTFSWMGQLLSIGHTKTIDLDDVPELSDNDTIKAVLPKFQSNLESTGITTWGLAKALLLTTWELILVTGNLALLHTLATYVGPYLISRFVRYLNGDTEFPNEGYVLVSVFVGAKMVECLSQRHWYFRAQQVGIRARAALVAVIYNKGLNLSANSRQGRTSGEMINLISVDADRIGLFCWYLHDIWIALVQVALALLVLYANVGLASVAALGATILIMLANLPLGRLQEDFQGKLMESKDTRMKATSEILRNMRILKLQAWEMKFLSRIEEMRRVETGWLKKYVYTFALTMFVLWGTPTFVSVATFGACIIMGIPLESGKVLSALATFGVLEQPIYNLPDTISMIIQTKVSLNRIATFLCLDELRSDVVEKLPKGASETVVEVTDGVFSWDANPENPTLCGLNFRILHGMRVAICGTVGSGKSTLLSCILGEVPKVSGSVKLCGTVAYVAQTAWIQSGKIEDNVLFGKKMDRERYECVLEACSLKKDLEILPFGDQTVIGERGINLSGGQKQRIQIARALYQDADVYLFDDPFSAVDAHTGSHLFKECLISLLASKTVIYVTHQVEFLPSADLILVMKQGRITQAGKYNEILESGKDFMELVGAHDTAMSAVNSMATNSESSDKITEESKNKESENGQDSKENGEAGIEKKGQLVQEEEREKGRVGFAVYWKYLTVAYGGALVIPILLVHILFEILNIGSDYWMAWAAPVSKEEMAPVSSMVLIYVYVALAIGSSFCVLVRSLLVATTGFKTATSLFNKMHTRIFRAPMSFFDSTPSGRILNRASTDQSEVDISIPDQISYFAFGIIELLGVILFISQVAWQILLVFIPVIAACYWYQNYYIETARELSRLSSVCKAPIIQHFAETLSGSTTIRSFGQESRFMETNFGLSDGFSRPKFYNAAAREWLRFRMDTLSLFTFAFALIFLVALPAGIIDPSIAGLAVNYGLSINMLQSWVVWSLSNLENQIISVERIFQYTTIPSEPPLTIDSNKPENDWPTRGEVDIHGLQVRYAPHMPFVLRGLTCTLLGGKKTGIVGRTGSGKSTLIQTLFRIVDPTFGHIQIDKINITTIGLHDLRSRLSIIPQDPTMFEGTIRSNLDPLEEYSDEQIWEALDKCQLGHEIRQKDAKLDSRVNENGENWSVGQRQLVCLGRVILKKSKILVLDEATASVDTATDNLIQKTLREQFPDSTVVTIAHRITSVLSSDRVLVLDNGLIAEYDTPSSLLENKSSFFAKLVTEYTVRSNTDFSKQ